MKIATILATLAIVGEATAACGSALSIGYNSCKIREGRSIPPLHFNLYDEDLDLSFLRGFSCMLHASTMLFVAIIPVYRSLGVLPESMRV